MLRVTVIGADKVARDLRGLADDLAAVERCDAIVLVGGRVSSGMAMERDHAKAQYALEGK